MRVDEHCPGLREDALGRVQVIALGSQVLHSILPKERM